MTREGARWGLLLAALGHSLAACGEPSGGNDNGAGVGQRGSCIEYCDRAHAASCAAFNQADCVRACVDAADLIADGQCSAEYSASFACRAGIPNVCDSLSTGSCNAEKAAYADCWLSHCTGNPQKDYCEAPTTSPDAHGGTGAASGRRPACFQRCDEYQQRGCAYFDHGDCFAQCVDIDELFVDTNECAGSYDAYLACAAALPERCDLFTSVEREPACLPEIEDYVSCFFARCEANPTENYCAP